MSVYLRGRTYWFKRTIDGQVFRRSLNIRKGQELLLSEAVKQMDLQVTADHLGLPFRRQLSTTFTAYVEKHVREEASQIGGPELEKKRQRLDIVTQLWGSLPLHKIGREDIARLELHLLNERKVKESTCNRYFEILRHLFRRALEDGIVQENPIRFYQIFREDGRRRALSHEELVKVVEAAAIAAKTPHAPNWGPILDLILFGLHTGARLSEILNLRLEYIRGPLALIPISETKSRRRAAHRQEARIKTIPLNETAIAAVEKYREGRSAGFVFPLRRRHPDVVHLATVKIRKVSGVKDFTFHALRHTFVTEAAERFGITTARNIVSHADLKTTARYTHPQLAEIQKAVTILGTTFPGYGTILSTTDKQKA
jgi:integrase